MTRDPRAYARGLGLSTRDAWRAWAHSPARPSDLPVRPDNVYRRQGWVSWYDWLGTTPPAQRWRPFPQARAYAQGLHFRSVWAWRVFHNAGKRGRGMPPKVKPRWELHASMPPFP